MPSTSPRQPTPRSNDLATPENIEDLGCVITTEAGGLGETAQAMVGWTVVNRMKNENLARVSDVWDQYAHGHSSNGISRQLAKDILDGHAIDISNGATHFYSPNSMQKAGETHSHNDLIGGLETVAGVKKNGKPVQNYRPYWAKGRIPIHVLGVLEKDFKFYELP